jgi:hypothetical protein
MSMKLMSPMTTSPENPNKKKDPDAPFQNEGHLSSRMKNPANADQPRSLKQQGISFEKKRRGMILV